MTTRKAVLVASERTGVLIGSTAEAVFWVACLTMFNVSAITFPDVESAKEYIRSWSSFDGDMTQYAFVEVEPDDGMFVTLDAVIAQGYGRYLNVSVH